MATNTKEIKDRIDSVEKTKKITQAMKMVSASKFKRHLKQLGSIKEYGEGVDTIIASLSKRLLDDDLPALMAPNDSPQVAIVILSSDRGLCGGFNSNLFKYAQSALQSYSQVDMYVVGNKAQQFYKSKNVNIVDVRPNFQNASSVAEISDYMSGLIQGFKKGVYSKVFVIYNEFVSALASNQVMEQLLPIKLPDWDPTTISTSDFIYEPNKGSALSSLFERYVSYKMTRAILESITSEEGFRMAAMDSASNNAKEMIQELTLFYNRSRQAAITTELTEIVAGAESIS
jgi:F-type H+-transporting ATPase subunit gamma